MSMSVDYRKIEQVTQFMGFVEAMSNPEALKTMVADLKRAADEVKAKLGVYDSLQKVKALEDEVAKQYDQMVKSFEEQSAQRAAALASAEAALKARQQQQASVEEARAADAKIVREKQQELSAREEKVAMAEKANLSSWLALEAKAKELNEIESKLSSKTAQLQKLLGE